MMVYNRPISIFKWNEDIEDWVLYYATHARVNKTKGSESHSSGAIQSNATATFDVRYCKEISDIELNTSVYRIHFNGATYDITDYDNYMYKNMSVRLIGVGRRG